LLSADNWQVTAKAKKEAEEAMRKKLSEACEVFAPPSGACAIIASGLILVCFHGGIYGPESETIVFWA